MGRRIILGLVGALGSTLLLVVGFFLGALPVAFLMKIDIIGPELDPVLPVAGLVGGWAAVRNIGRLKTWLFHRRLARRDRVSVTATIVGHDLNIRAYRGVTTWWYTLRLQWKDPVTGERRQLKRRYVLRKKRTAEAFRESYCATHPPVVVLVKKGAAPHAAVVAIPYPPVWSEMY